VGGRGPAGGKGPGEADPCNRSGQRQAAPHGGARQGRVPGHDAGEHRRVPPRRQHHHPHRHRRGPGGKRPCDHPENLSRPGTAGQPVAPGGRAGRLLYLRACEGAGRRGGRLRARRGALGQDLTSVPLMPFRDLIGQPHARLLLQGALRSARISHAYLFVGPSGVGRLTTARAFAQALLCSTGGEDAGGVGVALEAAAAGEEPFERRAEVLQTLRALERGDVIVAIDAAEAVSRRKDDLERWLDTALWWFRDLVVWQTAGDPALLTNLDCEREVAGWADRVRGEDLRGMVDAIEQAKAALRLNVNPRLVLETLFTRIGSRGGARGDVGTAVPGP